MFKTIGVFLLLGLLVAIFSQVEYETSATLMPEMESQSRAGGLLEQYGGLLGIGGGINMGSEGTIHPQLYPNVVQSIPYQLELMSTPVHFSEMDTTVSTQKYFEDIHTPSVLDYVIRFPGQIIGLFREEEEQIQPIPIPTKRDSVLVISKEQIEVIKKLRERINVSFDEGSGIVTLTSTMPDAQAAAEVGQAGVNLLKEYMREYRTQKALADFEFVQEQTKEARDRFEEIRLRQAEFRDSNVNLSSARAQTREQELQAQYDLAFNLYNSLNQQMEQARLNVQKQTPVFSVLQPIYVPLEKSSPKRLMILLVSGILGTIVAIGYVLGNEWWENINS